MSKLGKIPVPVPKDVKSAVEAREIRLEGPKGKLTVPVPYGIKVDLTEDKFLVSRANDSKQCRSNQGTIRALLVNSIQGVSKGHRKDLEIQGVGFRAQLKGTTVVLNLGFSHQVEFPVPKDVKVSLPQPTSISIEGIDKALVGQVAASLRDIKRPEPYKGKGIRYVGEVVRRKQGKSVTK